MAKKIRGPQICGLARCVKGDIDAAWKALKPAKKPRIHVFLATSDIHMEKKLKMSRQQVLDKIGEMVKYASKHCPNIEFSPEDAVRSDFQFLAKAVQTAIEAGARTINVPDTVGYAIPSEFGKLIGNLKTHVPGSDKAIFSVHCHNDLGLAVSNSLSAVLNGARQVECTVNGIGERAGNASSEEIVMALKTRQDFFHLKTGLKTEEIYRTSRLVSRLTGMQVQPNKAIVGANAFAHESGIHQDGVIKHRQTYEIMTPEDVGVPSSKLILGKLSGRNALGKRMKELGYQLSDKELIELFESFKVLADKKKYVFDEDLLTLMEEKTGPSKDAYLLDYLQTSSGTGIVPTATIRLSRKGEIVQEAACGDGPVDAVYKAIDKITKQKVRLVDYKLAAISGGKDAQGEVTVQLEIEKGMTVRGKGASTDIIEASAKAYLSAINRIDVRRKGKARVNPCGGESLVLDKKFIPKGIPEEDWIGTEPDKVYAVRAKLEDEVRIRLGSSGGLYLAISLTDKKERVVNLIDFENGAKTLVAPLPKGQAIQVGRTEESGIKIKHAIVSRRHAEILWDENVVAVRDFGSTNGTFLNKNNVHFNVDEYLAKREDQKADEDTLDWVHEEFGPNISDFLKRYKKDN